MSGAIDSWRTSRGTRIEKLPAPLRPPAIFIRNQLIDRTYVYRSDGLATAHYCPFRDDQEFESSYAEMAKSWFPGADTRWRMWLLTSFAQQCQHLPGNFAEFGTWRGGCAYMILSRTKVAADHRFFLFDTFTGIPADQLTAGERERGFAGAHNNTSVDHVNNLLAPWRPRYELCPGDVFQTLNTTDVGDLSFAHIDLNAAAPSGRALAFAYEHLLPRGIIVFDDYGDAPFKEQRSVIDEFFRDLPEQPIALPTCQAFVIKR